MTRAEAEAAYNDKPSGYIDDIGGAEEYVPVSVIGDVAEFRKDEADEEAESEQ